MQTFSKVDSKLQKEIFKKVQNLYKNGFGYKKIIKEIGVNYNVKLSSGTLSYWFNHENVLFGGINKFEANPSRELAYVLGVIFGDGNLAFDENKSDYIIRLEAIDRDFVKYFSKCISKVLEKKKNYVVNGCKRKSMDSIMYCAKARSKYLYSFLKDCKGDFEKVKPFAKAYPKDFIQGLADSEGCPIIAAKNEFRVNVCVASSMNIFLLAFVCYLLKMNFGIKSKVRLSKKKGMSDSIIKGRVIIRKHDLFELNSTDLNSIKLFAKEINFNIKRKNEKLIDAIFISENFKFVDRSNEWAKLYFKPKSK